MLALANKLHLLKCESIIVCAVALLCACWGSACFAESGSGATDSAASDTTYRGPRRKQLEKLKPTYFPQYQAKILLPVQYQRKDDEGNQLTVMGADIPHGMYMFLSMMAPPNVKLTPESIKPIMQATLEGMKAECAKETPLTLGQYKGLECRGKVKVDADVEAVVRGYVAGRRMYFLVAMGSTPWIKSKDVEQYLNSFEITL